MSLGHHTAFTWFGHGTFRVTTPEGRHLLLDPWVHGNPACPADLKHVEGLDAMLVTHGHFDHIADAVDLGKRLGCPTVGIVELCHWLDRKGVAGTIGMNKGGTVEVAGVRVTMVHADHSCGITEEDGTVVYGGEAVGFVVEVSNGFTFYFAGDTNVFGDMALIRELYSPSLAILPIGGHFTMGPREAAKAVELLGVSHVIPMHHGTFPVLAGTPGALRERLAGHGCEVVAMRPGDTLT